MIKDSVYVNGLIDYIKDIKPYSSKLTDVVVEYQYYDAFDVEVTDAEHFITMSLGAYWCQDFSYDPNKSRYRIAAALFPRRASQSNKTYCFIVGTDEVLGEPDKENPGNDLQHAFRVPGNSGVRVVVNGVTQTLSEDYRVKYSDETYLGVASSIIQFLPGREPDVGAEVCIDIALYDRLFFNVSNYTNTNGNNWLPYVMVANPIGDDPPLIDTWGGSYGEEDDPDQVPVFPPFDPDYDSTTYDEFYFDGVPEIDPDDYTNGVSNWDSHTWDGEENDFGDTSIITDFFDNTGIPGRQDMLIGSVKRLIGDNGGYYWAFEFNTQYADLWLPLGTQIRICVDQRNVEGDTANTGFTETFTFADLIKFDDLIDVRMLDKNPLGYEAGLFGEDFDDMFYGDASGADRSAFYGGEFDLTGFDEADINALYWGNIPPLFDVRWPVNNTAESSYSEEMEIYTQQPSYGDRFDSVSYDADEIEMQIVLNNPAATSGYTWSKRFLQPAKTITIKHNMGDTNPTGPYATQGGVIVEVIGAIPKSITNPYYSNVPALFTTTAITFENQTACTIKITKP